MTASIHCQIAANLQQGKFLLYSTFIDSGKPSDCIHSEFADIIIKPGEIIAMIVNVESLESRPGTPLRINQVHFTNIILESPDFIPNLSLKHLAIL